MSDGSTISIAPGIVSMTHRHEYSQCVKPAEVHVHR